MLEDGRYRLHPGQPAFLPGGGFVGTHGLGLTDAHREISLGWRLAEVGNVGPSFELPLEVLWLHAANDEMEHRIGAKMSGRW